MSLSILWANLEVNVPRLLRRQFHRNAISRLRGDSLTLEASIDEVYSGLERWLDEHS